MKKWRTETDFMYYEQKCKVNTKKLVILTTCKKNVCVEYLREANSSSRGRIRRGTTNEVTMMMQMNVLFALMHAAVYGAAFLCLADAMRDARVRFKKNVYNRRKKANKCRNKVLRDAKKHTEDVESAEFRRICCNCGDCDWNVHSRNPMIARKLHRQRLVRRKKLKYTGKPKKKNISKKKLKKRIRQVRKLIEEQCRKNVTTAEKYEVPPVTPEEYIEMEEEIPLFPPSKDRVSVSYGDRSTIVPTNNFQMYVSQVKSKVAQDLQLPFDEFYLATEGGKPLRENLMLYEYNLNSGNDIKVIVRGSGGASPPRQQQSELLANIPTCESIQKRIEKAYDTRLFHTDSLGRRRPLVCSVCDEFLIKRTDLTIITKEKLAKARHLLHWDMLRSTSQIADLEEQYRFDNSNGAVSGADWLDETILSPRGTYHTRTTKSNRRYTGFTSCADCKRSIDKEKMPKFAIANCNLVGNPPQCLLDLTDVELAMLTPMKSYGYCMTFDGGPAKNLKGTMVFMRVKERRIANAVMTLSSLGLTSDVIVLCTGRMTEAQRRAAKKHSQVRTDKLIGAVEWLVENHRNWKDINLDALKEELRHKQPIFVDTSEEVPSQRTNVEATEVFTCYFPEGANTTKAGGFDNPKDFKKYVEDLKKNGYDIELKCNLQKEFIKESEGDLLINTSLLQFPYGIGSFDEFRVQSDGSSSNKKLDLSEYLQHLTKLSSPVFQKPLFLLVVYTMQQKALILSRSRLQVKGKTNATALASGLTATDLLTTARMRKQGLNGGTRASKTLIDAVDAISKDLPHTNGAAARARSTSEAMQHHFGLGSIFLTVTFDDDNSFLMQVLSGVEVDKGEPIGLLSDDELMRRTKARREIRIQMPGVSSIHFEILMDILAEEVIGWDLENHCATEKPGFFGICEALSMANEEQGRKTLHVHATLWIKGYRNEQKKLFFGNDNEKRNASNTFSEYIDRTTSTSMFAGTNYELLNAFDHDKCGIESPYHRSLPEMCSDQQLRELRHKVGYDIHEGQFAKCPHCEKSWTYEELLADYLVKGKLLHQVGVDPKQVEDIPLKRMRATIVEYQKDSTCGIPETCINASYQHHLSRHIPGVCFRCEMKKKSRKRKHKHGPSCECRFRLPDRKRRKGTVSRQTKSIPWYEFNGEEREQPIVELLPKRASYDMFQNVCCPGISNSKFACNSNVSLITDGPVGQYQFKYQTKGTQADDQREYKEVCESIKKMDGRNHDVDRAEAIRRVCRAAFAHNKTNIIGVQMAAYLTRNGSRFYFSHDFVYCPLQDIMKLHAYEGIDGTIGYSEGTTYFENQALNYLCRPAELERMSAMDFFAEYVPANVTKKSADAGVLPFIHTTYFKHPAVHKKTAKVLKGCKPRDGIAYSKVSQWGWTDTADFGGKNIFTCDMQYVNHKMEDYARYVLTLLVPHRGKDHLTCNGKWPYVRKLRKTWETDCAARAMGAQEIAFTAKNCSFLQNLQNCKANAFRYKVEEDDLQRNTVPFDPKEHGMDHDEGEEDDDDDDDDEQDFPECPYELFLDAVGEEDDSTDDPMDNDMQYRNRTLKGFTFEQHRNKGNNMCGFREELDELAIDVELHEDEPFLKVPRTTSSTRAAGTTEAFAERTNHTIGQLVKVLFRRITRRSRDDIIPDKTVELGDATGSAASIIDWGKRVFKDDIKQRRAFECIMSSFILTFYQEPNHDDSDTTVNERTNYRVWYQNLLKLRGDRTKQLICLLHGPGGSGKSLVIHLVTKYAEEFCNLLDHPFTSRTLIISAMSGVAATLIRGDTAHRIVGLGRQNVTHEEQDAWEDCRLIIVDEISFASVNTFRTMDSKLRELMNNKYRPYGGLNVVFAGDYSQLEPVRAVTIYAGDDTPEFHSFLNCFLELDGMHRFKEDLEWGLLLRRFRAGHATREDINLINNTCCIENNEAPPGTRVATYYNKNRDAINTAVFEEYCRRNQPSDGSVMKNVILVFMDNLQMATGKRRYTHIRSNKVQRHFWEHVGEDDCHMGEQRGRVDPLLKLYPLCPVMETKNEDVSSGQANGTCSKVLQVELKFGEEAYPLELDSKIRVNAVFASQVECIHMEHENPDIEPQQYKVKPANLTFKAKLTVGTEEMYCSMKGTQFEFVSNSATTGHKLQGCTLRHLIVNDWRYAMNWPYVVLSRCRTMKGLHLIQKLKTDMSKYQASGRMLAMLQRFRRDKLITTPTQAEYTAMRSG